MPTELNESSGQLPNLITALSEFLLGKVYLLLLGQLQDNGTNQFNREVKRHKI